MLGGAAAGAACPRCPHAALGCGILGVPRPVVGGEGFSLGTALGLSLFCCKMGTSSEYHHDALVSVGVDTPSHIHTGDISRVV